MSVSKRWTGDRALNICRVNQYLEGTGQRGGPLVTTSNVTVQSDLRLYLSDHNETMKRSNLIAI